jgi:hypothetical protein
VLASIVACGAVLGQGMPPNTETEYLRTLGSGVMLDGKVTPTKIFYAITLQVRKPLPQNAVAIVRFENPDRNAAPVEAIYEPKPGEAQFVVFSPGVACIVNGRYYRAVVTLFRDRERSAILGTHEQTIAFSVPRPTLENLQIRQCGS